MSQTDLFGAYVRDRLDQWGRVFALHRDCEYLGHRAKNVLQVLIEHKGEMPAHPTGFKPLEVDPLALQIEFAVSDMAKRAVERACCLRAYYCGSGRRGVERLETAQELIRRITGRRMMLGRRAYFGAVEVATAEIRGYLLGIAQVA